MSFSLCYRANLQVTGTLAEFDIAKTPKTTSGENSTLDINGRKSSTNLCTEDQLSVNKLLVITMMLKRGGVSLCLAWQRFLEMAIHFMNTWNMCLLQCSSICAMADRC